MTDRGVASLQVHAHVMEQYADYLRDESRSVGCAEEIAFPSNEADICRLLQQAAAAGKPVTVQGGRTGITGGAVPEAGMILNLSRMNRIRGLRYDADTATYYMTVEPGVVLEYIVHALIHYDMDVTGWSRASLDVLKQMKEEGPFFFSPDPTEKTAAIGGMTACNASGARTFHYGATRPHIHALHAVLADGDILDLQRGRESAQGRKFELQTISGRRIKGALPSYTSLSIKNAAGYWVHDNMDLIDLFIGSEGTLGVFSQIELRLVPAPASIWGIMAFLPSEKAALQFVIGLRKGTDNASDRPVAIEFFDFNALNLLRSQRQHKAGFNELPALPEHFHTAIYVEYHGPNEDTVGSAIEHMCGLLENCGGSEDTAWIATEHHDLQRIYDFRHAVPESVNMIIDERRKTDPALTKLGTDMAVSDEHLLDVMHMYHADLADAGLEYVIFGHIGNNHVHVNILPRNQAEYRKGHELYADWARRVVQMGGTVSAEHGIGKLKRDYLVTMYSRQGVEEMRKLKELFDPWYQLNPGNLFL